jgi:hypothetical protein
MAEAVLPTTPYVGQDFYVPAYRVLVQGRELLEETHDITSVTYTESLNAIDSFDLTVNNAWEPDLRRFKYSDASTFMPWSQVQLSMGYFERGQDERRVMLTGEITTMTPSFPTSGAPTMSVRGLNLLHRFRLKQVTKAYFRQTDTQIAQDLLAKIDEEIRKQFPKLKLKIDPADVERNAREEQPVEFLVVQNQYPIVFLMERARRIGYELTIIEMPPGREREGEVVFGYGKTSAVTRATYELEWGKTLVSAQPSLRVADQVSKVTVRGWSPRRKEPITESATREDLRAEGVVDPRQLDLAEPAIAQEISVDRPVESAPEAKELAKQILRQKAAELVTVKAKTIGLPDLRAGSKVRILGLGRFSGELDPVTGELKEPYLFLVTETTHSIGDSGYTTDFTARMEAGEPV